MRLLLDTRVLLWALEDASALGDETRALIRAAEDVFVSPVSIEEAYAKVELKKLSLPTGFLAAVRRSGFSELPVTWSHIEGINSATLPNGDRFDRLLVVQALQEQMKLVTADEMLLKAQPELCVDGRV